MRNTRANPRRRAHSVEQSEANREEHGAAGHSHESAHAHGHDAHATDAGGGVTRFSVSLPEALARDLDAMVREKSYASRSLAVADMVRDALVSHRQHAGAHEIAGTITLVYDHHKHGLQETLTAIQHDHHEAIISTLHVHLDHHNCLEVLVVRGRADRIRKMADALIAARGVKHGKLGITSTGKDLAV